MKLQKCASASNYIRMKGKTWILTEKPSTKPCLQNFTSIEEELPECQEGDILIEAESLSVDPYIRYRIAEIPLKEVIPGSQLAKVIESKNEAYPVGTYGVSYAGWRTHTLLRNKQLKSAQSFMSLPDFGNLPKSLSLGVLGMPGISAYFGFLELCHPKEKETVLVNGAAGAVGSTVCQIAKIKGCRVIGFAGSHEKVSWLKELGVDHAFNYKITKVSEALESVAPNGIDCYFDNVGGDFTAEVMSHMAMGGRISLCGAISEYSDPNYWTPSRIVRNGPFGSIDIIKNQLTIRGFYAFPWLNRYLEAFQWLKWWIDEGKMEYRETVTRGFDQMPSAFIGLFDGENIGKSIVTVR